jgi:hypothetical protein
MPTASFRSAARVERTSDADDVALLTSSRMSVIPIVTQDIGRRKILGIDHWIIRKIAWQYPSGSCRDTASLRGRGAALRRALCG